MSFAVRVQPAPESRAGLRAEVADEVFPVHVLAVVQVLRQVRCLLGEACDRDRGHQDEEEEGWLDHYFVARGLV
ncbi:unnamed protein product [Sphagnum tenellum]